MNNVRDAKVIGNLFAEFEVYRNFCFPRKIEIPKSCEKNLKRKSLKVKVALAKKNAEKMN